MKCIGITGGIGSGKSMIADLFEVYGIPVYVADKESKALVRTSPVIRSQLTALLGEAIFPPEGFNARLMASKIFGDAALLEQVNGIIHPEVLRHFQSWVAQRTTPYCAIESAILFESGFADYVDVKVLVYASQALRLQRVMARDELTSSEVEQRMSRQQPDEEKRSQVDFIFENEGDNSLILRMEQFLEQLNQ